MPAKDNFRVVFSHTSYKVQNSKRNNTLIFLLFHILLDPDPKQ